MEEAGIRLDVFTYNLLINGFCTSMMLNRTYDFLKIIEEKGVKPNGYMYSILINGCFCCKKPDKAYETFEKMREARIKPSFILLATFQRCP